MRLVLVHGSLYQAANKKINEIKKGFDPLSIMEGENGGFINSPNLFSQKRLVILDNPDTELIDQALKQKDNDLTVLIKFSKTLEKSSIILKKAQESKAEIFHFEEFSKDTIFPFLDLLGNKNKKAFLEFEKQFTQSGGQYILTMIAYFLRRMIVPGRSDFMQQKIEGQKKNFSLEKMEELYKETIETDFKIKQGLTEEKLGVTLLVQKIIN